MTWSVLASFDEKNKICAEIHVNIQEFAPQVPPFPTGEIGNVFFGDGCENLLS